MYRVTSTANINLVVLHPRRIMICFLVYLNSPRGTHSVPQAGYDCRLLGVNAFGMLFDWFCVLVPEGTRLGGNKFGMLFAWF